MNNRRGFTLVEVIIAGSLFVLTVTCFNYLIKSSMVYITRAKEKASSLNRDRSELERLRGLTFDQLAATGMAEIITVRLDDDLIMIQAGKLYTLRSKY